MVVSTSFDGGYQVGGTFYQCKPTNERVPTNSLGRKHDNEIN